MPCPCAGSASRASLVSGPLLASLAAAPPPRRGAAGLLAFLCPDPHRMRWSVFMRQPPARAPLAPVRGSACAPRVARCHPQPSRGARGARFPRTPRSRVWPGAARQGAQRPPGRFQPYGRGRTLRTAPRRMRQGMQTVSHAAEAMAVWAPRLGAPSAEARTIRYTLARAPNSKATLHRGAACLS